MKVCMCEGEVCNYSDLCCEAYTIINCWDLYILHTNSLTGNGKSSVTVTFFSVIGASPPSCKIEWNYSYREPKTSDPAESLLPGCFVWFRGGLSRDLLLVPHLGLDSLAMKLLVLCVDISRLCECGATQWYSFSVFNCVCHSVQCACVVYADAILVKSTA